MIVGYNIPTVSANSISLLSGVLHANISSPQDCKYKVIIDSLYDYLTNFKFIFIEKL